MLRKSSLILLAFVFGTLYNPVFSQDSIAMRFSKSISAESMKSHLYIIASDSFAGRETGMPGQKKAADYIASCFSSNGIPPIINKAYFQEYPIEKRFDKYPRVHFGAKDLKFGEDYYCLPYPGELKVNEDKIIFLGNISNLKKTNADLKGKIVLLYDDLKNYENAKGVKAKENVDQLSEANPKVILVAQKKYKRAYNKIKKYFTEEFSFEEDSSQINKPCMIFISIQNANLIASGTNKSLNELLKEMNESSQDKIELSSTIKIKKSGGKEKLTGENVLGYLEGSSKKNELVVISAHYDHLGFHDDKIYHGADDDGSGTTGILELAEAFSKAKREGHGPKRSILFLANSGEEKGLLGSDYYVKHPVFPLENTVADLNIDMIGRIDAKHQTDTSYVYVIGSGMLSTELKEISEKCNSTYTKFVLDYTFDDPNDKNRFYYRSDHYNFAKNNIPVIFYFNGVHDDYHRPSDTPDKINYSLMAKRTQLVFFTAWELANRENRIMLDKKEEPKKQ